MALIKEQASKQIDFSIALIIFSLACLLFLKKQFIVSADLIQYLVIAENYLVSSKFSDVDNIPANIRTFFVWFLSQLLKSFNRDLVAVTSIISILSAFLPVTIYFLAIAVSTRTTAIFAALMVAFTPELIIWVPRHLDGIWPMLIFAAFALMLREEPKVIHVLVASFCGIVAVCIKVAAAPVFAILPIFLIHKFKIDKNVWLAFYLPPIISMIFLSASWSNELVGEEASIGSVFIYPSSLIDGTLSGYLDFSIAIIFGVISYFIPTDRGAGIFHFFPFYTFLFVCFITFGALELRKRSKLGVLFIHYWTFVPLIAYSGLFDLRFSQFIYGICLPYIYLMHGITHYVVPYIQKRFFATLETHQIVITKILYILFISVSFFCLQLTSNVNVINTFQKTIIIPNNFNSMWRPGVKELTADLTILLSNISREKSKVVVAFEDLKTAREATFFSDQTIQAIMFPWIYVGDQMTNKRYAQLGSHQTFSGITLVKANSDRISSRTKVAILNSEQLIKKMDAFGANNLIIKNKEKEVIEFIKRTGNFVLKRRTKKYVLFEFVKNELKGNCELIFDKNLDKFYAYLIDRDEKRYQWYINTINNKIRCEPV